GAWREPFITTNYAMDYW
nr:immunoglobulin heavy chain junction region [Mus musculus]MBK4186716.1 immunoglobulin heavy chain junction region [Mus musculus]MBK4186717.1 immunoglobulin heavy chain junction region [Mus musculus]